MSSVRRQNARFSQVFTSYKSSGTGAAGRGLLPARCHGRRHLRAPLHMHEPERGPAGRLCKAAPALTGSHFINSLSSSCSFKCSIITNKAVTLCLQLYNLAKCRYDLGFEEERDVRSRGGRREEPGEFEAILGAALDGEAKGESAITPSAPARWREEHPSSLRRCRWQRARRTGRAGGCAMRLVGPLVCN